MIAIIVGSVCINNDAFAAGACYIKAKGGCGKKSVAAAIAGVSAAGAGIATGMAAGTLFGPTGAVAGSIAGGIWAGKAGAKLGWGASSGADEYIYFSDHRCLECDGFQLANTGECTDGMYVTNGGEIFRCQAKMTSVKEAFSNDKWVKESVSVCSNSPVKNPKSGVKYKYSLKGSGEKSLSSSDGIVVVYSSKPCRYIEEIPGSNGGNGSNSNTNNNTNNNTNTNINNNNVNVNVNVNCNCSGLPGCSCQNNSGTKTTKKTNSCIAGRSTKEGKACCYLAEAVAKWEGGKCICQGDNMEFKIDGNGKGKCVQKQTSQTCEDKYKGNDDAIACCNAEKSGDASWIVLSDKTERCVCNEEDKTWNKETKKCEANTSGGEDVLTDCEYTRDVQIKCYNGNSYTEKLKFKLTQEQVRKLGKKDCKEIKDDTKIPDDILAQTNEYISRFNALCSSATVQAADHTREISEARSKLERFFSTTESNASVWKDAEGNFNKARLVSDATAGVVLGTVGGVVSSKIIKKKQLEKGYDVLHCTVGGQTVADWGDEFNVSMGRR